MAPEAHSLRIVLPPAPVLDLAEPLTKLDEFLRSSSAPRPGMRTGLAR